MKIEIRICDRCGKEISPLLNKPSITLQKENTELDLCGLCITSFFEWYNEKEKEN